MNDWKRLTTVGNRCFERGELAAARAAYQEALISAERWLLCGEVADDAVAAFVVTHQNLAEVYAALDDGERAFDHLRIALDRLLRVLAACEDRPELQAAALRHYYRARMAMLEFVRSHGLSMTLEERRRSRRGLMSLVSLH